MKNTITPCFKYLFLLICLGFLYTPTKAQIYTSTYNNINYSSSRPYNLNVIYFVPNDIPLDNTYKTRLSALLLWGQDFYKQNMINNGYGSKTFGLFTETTNSNNVKLILIQGLYPHTSYTYNNPSQMNAEIDTYFTSNPTQKTSDHNLIISAVTNPDTSDVPFYGLGKNCYALDYPQFDIQYLGSNSYSFIAWFGGMIHELGHGINLPHSHQTNTENINPNKGMNLMFAGNSTLGISPTFINRAGTAILNNSQVFADIADTRYNGHTASFNSIHTSHNSGSLTVSGTFQSNITVKDVNIYQDPYATPSPGYYRVAWSVAPVGNTYSITMPISELASSNGPYNLQIELVLENGETEFAYFPFSYISGAPDVNINFDGVSTCAGGSLQFTTNNTGTSYKWQYLAAGGWNDYSEGNVSGYATFSGTQTSTMTISNISSIYITNPNTIRVAITQSDGSIKYSSVQTWKANTCSLATSETKKIKNLSAYPNPVKDELTVDLGTAKDNYNLEITNTLGEILYKITTSEKTIKIPFSNMPSGIYFVNINSSSNKTNTSFKVIKE
ncbi:T9SS type A sorting domain-containing protein [Chryseobacterium polytrichastri]|uniref:Por secretion system C-terminal sorting domain-containing protein n=1 Tax=Chryseobacterium polytrichastri TaxID=1302687 RepID=A0A1M7L5X3_9FLAO|nr:T9SS type A sorting domain-containing protein [Chryseobacterium polytrichastri]SHM73129.1 Por secretion system C-terminal sorting domain-containing protein [Chryseobacterium polytrichastri]